MDKNKRRYSNGLGLVSFAEDFKSGFKPTARPDTEVEIARLEELHRNTKRARSRTAGRNTRTPTHDAQHALVDDDPAHADAAVRIIAHVCTDPTHPASPPPAFHPIPIMRLRVRPPRASHGSQESASFRRLAHPATRARAPRPAPCALSPAPRAL